MQHTSQESKTHSSKVIKETDIISAILEDHKPLKKLISIMKDTKCSDKERINAFQEFMPTLIAHAKPEEEILYTQMKKIKPLRSEGFEGEIEHTLADQLLEESKRTDDHDMLLAKIKVLAELVEHHIKEEENVLLPSFKEESTEQMRSELGNKFLQLKVKYLAAGDDNIVEDPKAQEKSNQLHH